MRAPFMCDMSTVSRPVRRARRGGFPKLHGSDCVVVLRGTRFSSGRTPASDR